jgi:hypothetical protein
MSSVDDDAISTNDGIIEQHDHLKTGATGYTAKARIDRLLAMVYKDHIFVARGSLSQLLAIVCIGSSASNMDLSEPLLGAFDHHTSSTASLTTITDIEGSLRPLPSIPLAQPGTFLRTIFQMPLANPRIPLYRPPVLCRS